MPKNSSRQPRKGRSQRHIRSKKRPTPDLQKIAGTVIAFALAQAEKEAQSEAGRSAEEQAR